MVMRDAKTYCAVLLDDNNRKPLCRLRFNMKQRYLGLFDANKTETKMPLETLNDIFLHSEALRATATAYETVAISD
jgi:hypothetical protein